MISRVIAVVIVLGAGGTVAAQTPVNIQLASDARHQVGMFEDSLRVAIVRAGGQLAERARQVVPDIDLRFETEIRVTGTPLPSGEGLFFLVEVPGIEATSAQLWEVFRRMGQASRVGNGAAPRTAAPMVVPADPVISPMSNPVKEYSEFTRQALLDTMLDNAFALPLKEGQTLTLMVGVVAGAPTAAIGDPPKRLYLRMKAEDLMALRQTRITRDEARKRIEEFRY